MLSRSKEPERISTQRLNDRYEPQSTPRSTLSPRTVRIHRQHQQKIRFQQNVPSVTISGIASRKAGKLRWQKHMHRLRLESARWMKAQCAREYRGIQEEENNAKIRAQQTRIITKNLEDLLPKFDDKERKALSKMNTALWHAQESENLVNQCRERWIEAEKKCVLESADLLKPIHSSLESISSVDNPHQESIFTLSAIEELIPTLPPRKALLTFDPEAARAAKHAEALRKKRMIAKMEADNANNIFLKRKPREVSEIVLTALSIIAKPEEYRKVADHHCHGKQVDDSTHHCAREVLQERPFVLVDDAHFEDMIYFLHDLSADLFTTSLLSGHSLPNIHQRSRRSKSSTSKKSKHTRKDTRNHTKVVVDHEAIQAHHDRDAAKSLRKVLVGIHGSGSGTFFDPMPKLWQVRELSHCLGGPFLVEANVVEGSLFKVKEIFSQDYLQMRNAAMNSLQGKDQDLQLHIQSPMFVLLRLTVSILHLWRSLLNLPARSDKDGKESTLYAVLAQRQRCQTELENVLLPNMKKTKEKLDICTCIFSKAQEDKEIGKQKVTESEERLSEDLGAHDRLEKKAVGLLRMNECTRAEAQAWESTNDAASMWLHDAQLGSRNCRGDKTLLVIATNTTTGKSGVGVKKTTTSDLAESAFGRNSNTAADNVLKRTQRLGLIDAAASRMRFYSKCYLPALLQHGGSIVRCGAESGVGAGGRHILRALFPSLPSARKAKEYVLSSLRSISSNPVRSRRGGLVCIPNLRQRLGGVTVDIVTSLTGIDLSPCGCVVEKEVQETEREEVLRKEEHNEEGKKRKKEKQKGQEIINDIAVTLQTTTQIDSDRIIGDFLLRDKLLLIAADQERECEELHVKKIREDVAKKYALDEYSVLVLRLVWSDGEEKKFTNRPSWDSIVPSALLRPQSTNDQQMMPTWICLQTFADVCSAAGAAEQVISMKVLEENVVNPVVCYASKSTAVLTNIVEATRANWSMRTLFDALGATVLRQSLCDAAKQFTIQAVVVVDAGPILINGNTEENERSIMMLNSSIEQKLEVGFSECGCDESLLVKGNNMIDMF